MPNINFMITLFRSNTICPLAQVKDLMMSHIKQLPAKFSLIGDCPKILRYELNCEPINILTWLHNQKSQSKIYWSNRNGDFEIGSIGIADCIKATGAIDYKNLFETIEDRLSEDNPHLRYYGGIGFDSTTNATEWQEIGSSTFVIPQFEINQFSHQTTFAFNIKMDDISAQRIESIADTLEQINFSLETTYRKVPQILSRCDFPNREGWDGLFDATHMKHGKIVLARKSIFDFDVDLRADALLKHLKDRTPQCYHFCFQFNEHTAFIGASPERLYKRNQRTIESEAIAGTRPRGGDERQDKELEQQLLNSPKDADEHRYVVDAIRNALNSLCESLKFDNTFCLRKLKGSQHLATRFEGKLKKEICDQEIMKLLHPTPAVAGCPTKVAMESIKQFEPFSRGWYAGPVGTVGYNMSEFAVAIRCGLVQGNQLSLYAGAGIVAGSTAQGEWDEIENKISNFMKVFK